MADHLPDIDDHPPDKPRSENAHALAGMTWLLIIVVAVVIGIGALSFFEPSIGILSGLAFIGFVVYVGIRGGYWSWYWAPERRWGMWVILGFFVVVILFPAIFGAYQ